MDWLEPVGMKEVCSTGCGFFASWATDGLCSLCYRKLVPEGRRGDRGAALEAAREVLAVVLNSPANTATKEELKKEVKMPGSGKAGTGGRKRRLEGEEEARLQAGDLELALAAALTRPAPPEGRGGPPGTRLGSALRLGLLPSFLRRPSTAGGLGLGRAAKGMSVGPAGGPCQCGQCGLGLNSDLSAPPEGGRRGEGCQVGCFVDICRHM
jgi:hypothetical protein